MSVTRKRIIKWIFVVATAGIFIAYLGLWLNIISLWLAGMILAIPLFVIVLPICLYILLAVITRPIWLPFYKYANRTHGAPFQSGDWVRILRGPHKNKVVSVYEVWNERYQVRVDLGGKEKEDFTDIFSFLQVQRVQVSEQVTTMNEGSVILSVNLNGSKQCRPE